MSAEMKRFVIESKQGPFAVISDTIPEPTPGEIQVRIEATSLNPADWKIHAYSIWRETYPTYLGFDGAGVVTKLGEGVTSFAVGDKVYFQGGFSSSMSTFQQYSTIPAEIAAKIPSNLTVEQAAAIPVVFITAAMGLSIAGVPPVWEDGSHGKFSGQPIVIMGGASSIGQFAIQFAKIAGFSPIITTASLHNTALLEALGATHVLDRKLSDAELEEQLLKITQEPIKVVFDTISSPETQVFGYKVLSPGGAILIVLPLAIEEDQQVPDKKIIHFHANVYIPEGRAFGVSLFKNITKLFESEKIKPLPIEILPNGLNGIPEGLERLKNGQVSGKKLIALPQETA